MATKLFVGSLPYTMTDEELEALFVEIGSVTSAKVIFDRDTGRSKGFGFVEMESDEDAKAAIDKLNGSDVNGRSLVVNEARPQEPRGERRSFGGNSGGGGYNDRDRNAGGGGRRY
jgi:RNA recognition motif-containing protein